MPPRGVPRPEQPFRAMENPPPRLLGDAAVEGLNRIYRELTETKSRFLLCPEPTDQCSGSGLGLGSAVHGDKNPGLFRPGV